MLQKTKLKTLPGDIYLRYIRGDSDEEMTEMIIDAVLDALPNDEEILEYAREKYKPPARQIVYDNRIQIAFEVGAKWIIEKLRELKNEKI